MKNQSETKSKGESVQELMLRLFSAAIGIAGMTAGLLSISLPTVGFTQPKEVVQAPMPPRNVIALFTHPQGIEIEVTWEAPSVTPASGIAGYEVYRDGILIERLPATRNHYVRRDSPSRLPAYTVRVVSGDGFRSTHGGPVIPAERPLFDLRASL